MQNLTGPIKTSKITTQQTVKKVIYQNGEKVSEETSIQKMKFIAKHLLIVQIVEQKLKIQT